MKHKMIIALLVLTLLLSGCSAAQPSRVSYIGADSAKAAAADAAGLQIEQATFSGVDMNTREGIDYYHVQFTSDGKTYEYDVDALTGRVIEAQSPANNEASVGSENATVSQPKDTQVTEPNTSTPAEQQPQTSASQEATGGNKEELTEDEVKAIALAHAGVSADEVTFVKCGMDWDDGRKTYDLEFYTKDYREFDYDIDPYSGEILSFDHDAEYYQKPEPPSSNNNGGDGSKLTADEAKAIALAQVPGATKDNIREFETDYDDGRLEYEGKIYYDHMEYEFEIDGYSGAIRSWDVESIYD